MRGLSAERFLPIRRWMRTVFFIAVLGALATNCSALGLKTPGRGLASVDAAPAYKVSPELLKLLVADLQKSMLTVTEDRRVYSWLKADSLLGDESTYASTEERLIQRFTLFSRQYWGKDRSTYSGLAGMGTYAALDPSSSHTYGYDSAHPDQWILASILIPTGTRFLDLRSFSVGDTASRLLWSELGCRERTYRGLIEENSCYFALKQALRELQVSGIFYEWGSYAVSCDRTVNVAAVLFNEGLFNSSSVRHFRAVYQASRVTATLPQEVLGEMPLIARAVKESSGIPLWPEIEAELQKKLDPKAERKAQKVAETFLACSDAWKNISATRGSLATPAFPLANTNVEQAPLVPISGFYKGVEVIRATWGGNFHGNAEISRLKEVRKSCGGKRRCGYRESFTGRGSEDPAPGVPKQFRVRYGCSKDMTPREVLTGESITGQELELSCGKAGRIDLISADILPQYKPIDAGNVTEPVKSRFYWRSKMVLDFTISSRDLGDPLPGFPKSFELEYACPQDPTLTKRIEIPAPAEGKSLTVDCR